MKSDLDAAIRTALHTGEVDANDLHRPTLIIAPAQGRRWLAAVGASALVALLAVGSAVALAAHSNRHGAATGHSASALPSAPSARPGFRYLGPLKRARQTATGSLLLEPPTGAVPRLTPAQAFNGWCAVNAVTCGQESEPAQIVLALLTKPNSGYPRKGTLGYVVILHNATCYPTGGAVLGSSGVARRSAPTTVTCTKTFPINANTGAGLGEYDG